MRLFWKFRSLFHDDWCKKCGSTMEIKKHSLYMLPVLVSHYVSYQNANYYIDHLVKVNKKADIPIGYYACGIFTCHCPSCGYKTVKLSVFLPVRDQEKEEDIIYFEHGEMDNFLYQE